MRSRTCEHRRGLQEYPRLRRRFVLIFNMCAWHQKLSGKSQDMKHFVQGCVDVVLHRTRILFDAKMLRAKLNKTSNWTMVCVLLAV